MIRLPKAEATARLKHQLEQLDAIKDSSNRVMACGVWKRATDAALRNIFEDHSNNVYDYRSLVDAFEELIGYAANTPEMPEHYDSMAQDLRQFLQDRIEEIQEYGGARTVAESFVTVARNGNGSHKPTTRDVFIVHGHDEALKNQVARFLAKLDLNPVILAEQPDKGRAIIEKFQDYAGVSFYIALFTSDDLGESKDKIRTLDDLKPRPRQNVVFEFGFSLASLDGRRP